jgi:hypothetical protein
MRDYLELVRLPNVFTAMADVVMGLLVVGADNAEIMPEGSRAMGLLISASALFYMSGMILNDVFDFRLDIQQRPERPLPSGRIPLSVAKILGWTMLILALLLSLETSIFLGNYRPAAAGLLLAGCIVAYDALLKQTVFGPAAMGVCRGLNVLLGMSVIEGPLQAEHWVTALSVGVYIAAVTWLARTETITSRRSHIAMATLLMALALGLLASLPAWSFMLPNEIGSDAGLTTPIQSVPMGTLTLNGLLLVEPWRWYALLLVLGTMIGWRWVWAVVEPLPSRVQLAVGHSILSLIILDAVACFALRDLSAAVAVLFFLLPTMFFQKWFAST